MALYPYANVYWVVAIGIVMSFGCLLQTAAHKHISPKEYHFSGTIYKEYGGARYSKMQCRSDSGLIKHGLPDLNNGSYHLSLSAQEANALLLFRIIDGDGDATDFEFDRQRLKDSIITIDFHLKTIPRNYRVEVTSTEHPPTVKYDTIWVDLNGKRVSKVLGDSLWRDIPHK